MRVVLLCPTPPDCVAFGPRQLASVLRQRGHPCSIVFLRGGVGRHRHDGGFVYQYPATLVDEVVRVCRDADVVGLSFMSLYWDRAVQLTRAVQERLGKPVIWGGTHATVRPEQSLRIADQVCVGEGEIAFTQWLDELEAGRDPTDVPGIWHRKGDAVHRTGAAPDVPDLDALPWPDFDTAGHWIDRGRHLVPMTTEHMHEVLPRLPWFGGDQVIGVRVMATRGCPHRCTYCASSAQRPLRRRSVESTIEHLRWLVERYPFLQAVYEFDDTFFATPRAWLREFATSYADRVGLPWYCQTSPSTLTRDKLELLVGAGLVSCEMGVQSGSPRIRELFGRRETDEMVRRAAGILDEQVQRGRMLPPRYHVITDVPWEDAESALSTVRLLLSLPRPFELAIGSLCLFPGTALAERAHAEGLLWDEVGQVYRKPFIEPSPSWPNWLLLASSLPWVPRRLLDALARSDRGRQLDPTRTTRILFGVTRAATRLPRGWAAWRHRDLDRIRRALRGPR